MGNPCRVVITRGKNKGNICGNINVKCKHVIDHMMCDSCEKVFDRTTSYYRHINTCDFKVVSRHPHNTKIKVLVSVKAQKTENLQPMSNVFNRLDKLEEQNNALREEVEELKLKPTTTNYIAILGDNFYTELTNKIGRKNAMKFLAESGTKDHLSVFQKLYLDDRDPDDYPIACRDKYHFRYMDDQKRVVDDRGGSTLGNALSKQITDAVEHAVHDFEIEGHGNSVYGLEGVQLLRKRLELLDKDSVIKELAYITNNPDHPFFRDDTFDV